MGLGRRYAPRSADDACIQKRKRLEDCFGRSFFSSLRLRRAIIVVREPLLFRLQTNSRNWMLSLLRPPQAAFTSPRHCSISRKAGLLRKFAISFCIWALTPFSPTHDIGIGSAQEVAEGDLAGLDDYKAVLAVLNRGDAGTIFGVGYAAAKGFPVVALAQNMRPEGIKMLEGTGCLIVGNNWPVDREDIEISPLAGK